MAASTPHVPETSAEHDARQLHSGHRPVDAGEIAIGVIIGRTSEFFDFFVYAIASVLVFPSLIFSFADPLTGTLLSFAVFALAFVARPIGTAIFLAVDRRYGRGVKLTIALMLLGVSTVATAFLPSYDQVGWLAVAILVIFRIGQGLALAGTWDGLASLLALNAPQQKRGWFAMVPQLGAPIGLIVASALFAYLSWALSAEDFLGWGWRYPFFVAFAINIVALFARLRIVVTPEYTHLFESGELEPSSLRETISNDWRNIVIGAFAPLASFALFHMVTVFPLSYVFLYTQEVPANFLVIEIAAACVGLVAVVLSGYLADSIGRRRLLGYSAAAIGVFSIFAPLLLGAGQTGETIYMIIGFALLGVSFGQSSGVVAANFTRLYRYTGSALTSDLAWLFGAGFAPLVALLLSSNFGLISSGAYLLSGAVCTLVALYFNRHLARTN
ncbi:arabinose ABC transporter permease [Devosia sp. Root685]|uniref:MFS transporter n=1 Tax=Devosia sp. Root685 TaxID=1736587 RepID=UPI000701C373|nr:MFS transporter [Devosia sp. Root685]KRA97659.1 arabinose ABC transporter permease [Devosia sp. Root685]